MLGSAKIKQEYVADGKFGPTSLVEMEHGFEVTFKAGDPIECSAGAQAKFGYSRESRGPAGDAEVGPPVAAG